MNRKLLAGAVVLAATLGTSAPAFAGEITGNGKPTPIADYNAGSICSFSGQNDDPDSEEMFEGGRVQSFGDIVQEAVKLQPGGASVWVPVIRSEGPGTSCVGYAAGGGGE
jgi:hypothetical protein